jgi:hypothetical protein
LGIFLEKVITVALTVTFGGIVLALAVAFGWRGRELAKEFLESLYRRTEKKHEERDLISHV